MIFKIFTPYISGDDILIVGTKHVYKSSKTVIN